MTPELATELIKAMMMEAVLLASPILLTGMTIGLRGESVSDGDVDQERTLTFVPKAMGIVALLVILLPWMVRTTIEFAAVVIQKIPEMAR